MQPIFMSPSFEQADNVKRLLARHEIDASIIEKAGSSQIDSEERIKWYELWLRKHSNAERASAIITQYEFDTLRNNLNNKPKVRYDQTQPMVVSVAYEEPAKIVKTIKFHNALKSRRVPTQSQLPVNNKAVFQRLASALGAPQKADSDDHNKILRPWNSKSLVNRVKDLRQLTK